MVRMFMSAHASANEQCSWWKVSKQSKRDLASEITWPLSCKQADFFEAWAWSCRSTALSLLHKVQDRFGVLYPTFSSKTGCLWKGYFLEDKTQTNLTSRAGQAQKFIQHSSMMNPDEEHHEFPTFWWRTQQHSDVHPGNATTFWWSECSPRFSSKSLWGPGHVA